MRICVPTTTQDGANAEVYEHFGSAPYFTIYDTTDGTVAVITNANPHHAHGMCHPLGALEGKRIDAVVTGGMGAGAVQKLNAAGIRVFRAVPGTVAGMTEQFSAGKLEELTARNACAHHGRH